MVVSKVVLFTHVRRRLTVGISSIHVQTKIQRVYRTILTLLQMKELIFLEGSHNLILHGRTTS